MYTVSVETHFWASHQLTLSDGSKEPVHHHNWRVIAEVGSDRLDSMAVVMDFEQLKAAVGDITAALALQRNHGGNQGKNGATMLKRGVFL